MLQCAWLRPTEKSGVWTLQITNTFVFVVIQVFVENEEPLRARAEAAECGAVPLPPKALLELERSRAHQTEAYFEADGSVTVGDTTFHPPAEWPQGTDDAGYPEPIGSFPQVDRLKRTQKKTYEIGLDVDYLKAAAVAMGDTRLRLIVDVEAQNVVFYVRPLNSDVDSREALMMPIRLLD